MIPFSATALVLLYSLAFHEATAENTTYVVALLGQDIQNGTNNTDITYELVITNQAAINISVVIIGIDGPITTLSVADKEVHTLDQKRGLNGSEYSNKSLIVQSQDGFFTLQVFTKRNDPSYVEGLLGIPIQQLAGPHKPTTTNDTMVYNYVVATFCDIGGYCQLAVAAVDNDTAVSVILPKHVESIALCKGKRFFRTGRDKTITLNTYDALQLETTYDLTGTVIYSFKPIVVFAGSRNVKNGNVVAHTMEQLVPSSHWGTEYIVQNLGTNGYGDILKIVSHWSETKVTMKGFPPFIMTERLQTAVRRLDKGFSSHIQASHPIQVIQITGLTYATVNETSSLSMTVVPSVQNALTEPTRVSCHGEDSVHATFYMVEEKPKPTGTDERPSYVKVNHVSNNNSTNIKYSDYQAVAVSLESTNTIYTISNTAGPTNGVMRCDTAVMPTYVLFNESVSGTTTMTPEYTGGICYEGGKASTKFVATSGTATPHTLDLTKHPEHVLELRVRVCGEAVLQFIPYERNMTNSLFLTVTHKQVIVKKCFPDCTTASVSVVQDTGFHSAASQDWDCEADMAYFWFLQNQTTFCFGFGRYRSDVTKCQAAGPDTNFAVPDKFKQVRMMGLASKAGFTWDFIHTDGCDVYESDWRCADRWTNCSMYGTNFCHNQQFRNFSHAVCAKFCGKCFTDSYGRKFILRVPYIQEGKGGKWCKILVSPLNKLTNVAVSFRKKSDPEKVVHGTLSDTGERYFDCTYSLNGVTNTHYGKTFYTILSDDDIAVVVMYQCDVEIKSYRVYPVDTFDTEFMMLDYSTAEKQFRFVTEHENVNYVIYHTINGLIAKDSEKQELDLNSFLQSTNTYELSGSLIIFNKPSSIFCGDDFNAGVKAFNYYNHILPLRSWSTEYVIPAFDEVAISRPFEAKLLIVSNADNTIVNITGGFDAVHAIYNRGDLITQDIDAGAAYKVTASQKIGVGLYLYDPVNTQKSSFHVLSPSQNLHDTVVTSAPNKLLDSHGFEVTDITTYFVNGSLETSSKSKNADDNEEFYRHVHLNSAVFGMTVVKSGNEKWFVIPGNIKSKVLYTDGMICNISTETEGDKIDNDCDGLVNEDVSYSNYGVYRDDRDLDGGFGEDSSMTNFSAKPVVFKPIDPMCLEINKPANQCWVWCSCKCSDVERFEAMKNMTKKELEEALQEDTKKIIKKLTIDKEALSTTAAKRLSARDKRKSAASIGYVGIALFALVFGTIVILDISSLLRDARILLANLREGFDRLSECFKRREGQKILHTEETLNT